VIKKLAIVSLLGLGLAGCATTGQNVAAGALIGGGAGAIAGSILCGPAAAACAIGGTALTAAGAAGVGAGIGAGAGAITGLVASKK